jgi:nucleoside-diphosphate-sugar epimerase
MKALVTGGGGFLGRAIVAKLLDKGYSVRILCRREHADLRGKGVEVVRGDIADRTTVHAACFGIDVVFHTAAITSIWGKWKEFFRTNVIGTRNVMEACMSNGIGKLVYTSSPSVVYDGTDQLNIDETAPYPRSFLASYPETKALAEHEVREANGRKGLHTVCLRPHLIWGPGDTNLIPRLINRARKGNIRIVGDGKNMIDTVYIDNAADAHLLAADRLEEGAPAAGSVYFITQGEPVNCWDWINSLLSGFNLPAIRQEVSFSAAYRAGFALEMIYRILDLKSEPRMTRFLASQLAKSHTYSIEKARRELGYRPAVDTAEGMKKLFASRRVR